jgi:peptidoglycan/LPS O-acetylase OafA/YrhL
MNLSGKSYSIHKLFDGDIAVKGFFIISGLLIIRSYWNSKTLKGYFLKRCKRLLPSYYLVILACAVGLAAMSTMSAREYFTSPVLWKYILCNALFMNFLQPSVPGVFSSNPNTAVNGSLWTIKLEIGFYIIVPIIVWLLNKCKTIKRMNISFLCLYVSAYIYRLVCNYIFSVTENNLIGELAHQLPGYIQYFTVGMFCAVNYQFVRKYEKHIILPAMVLVGLHYVTGTDYLLPIGLGTIIMFVGFNFVPLNNIGKIGDYSYGVYIFHFPIVQIFVALGYYQLNQNVVIFVIMGTVFSIAYVSWHFLEKRILKR